MIVSTGRVLVVVVIGHACNIPYFWVKKLSQENYNFLNLPEGRNLFFVGRVLFSCFNYIFFPVLVILTNPRMRNAIIRDFLDSRLFKEMSKYLPKMFK